MAKSSKLDAPDTCTQCYGEDMKRVTHSKKISCFRKFWSERQGPPYDAAIFAVLVMGAIAVAVHLCR